MIINTGQRTDIPAFYSEWLCNRLEEGYVCVRNPYEPRQVSRYRLDPEVVDVIGFCTKNPEPMLPHMSLLRSFGQFWYVTITCYGEDLEPNVPRKEQVIESFQRLSELVGANAVGWRYDPIVITEKYSLERQLESFEQIARKLAGYTGICVFSFIDMYQKVLRNFPEARPVSLEEKEYLGKNLIRICRTYGMEARPCHEGDWLAEYGADCSGCMTIPVYERAIRAKLRAPKKKGAREGCGCYLACDIGAYDTCAHLCRYCYANSDSARVRANRQNHDPRSPFLIGHSESDDVVHEAGQRTWVDRQMSLFDIQGLQPGGHERQLQPGVE